MRIRKTLITVLAVAIAVAFSPLSELQAATFINPGSQPAAGEITHAVKLFRKKKAKMMKMKMKAKGKAKRKKRKGKRARSKAGHCGTYMYWSKKSKKCMDARNK